VVRKVLRVCYLFSRGVTAQYKRVSPDGVGPTIPTLFVASTLI
jgi:hypothetical protein